jgi:hypothetical protein
VLTARNGHWRAVIDADLETSRTPLDQIERRLSLERSNCRVAVSGNDISTVEKSHSHVFSLSRVTDHHLVGGLCALAGELIDPEALMRRLFLADDRSIADQRVMDAWVWHQIGLEFVEINIQGPVKTQTGGYRRHDLSNEPVQMLKVWAWNVEITAADLEDSFVVDQKGAIRVLDSAVGGKNSIVWFDNCSRNSRGRIDGEFQL